MWHTKIDKIKEGNREKRMKNIEAKSLGTVHTHTQVYLYKMEKQDYTKKTKIN